VGGEDVVWAALYNQRRPRRVSLPTYPFLRERHWISDSPTLRNDSKSAPVLHQFISHNSSTLREVSFSSCLSEGGFYSVDHKVNGSMIFPGAGYLEIACMAGYLAGEKRVRTLRDVAWVQPLRFQTGFQTLRTVLRDLGGDIEYVISSVDEEGELVLHSEGRLGFAGTSLERDRVPISELKAQCQHREDGAAYYRRSREFGFEYGPSFQSIQELYRNGSFALARLNLPEHLRAGASQFVLHPSIIDGAIQTAGGLAEARRPGAPRVPFALDELLMIRPVPENSYAYVELAEPNDAGRAGISRFNIQVVSEQGDPLILLKNLYVRELSTDAQPAVHAEVGAPA
jgi:acyl transferase domain-containing protein